MKQKLIILLISIFISFSAHSQMNFSTEVGPYLWTLNHSYDNVSHPMTLGYELGFKLDIPIHKQSITSGLELRWAPATDTYTDKTFGEDVFSSIYESVIFNTFTANSHYEIGIPLVYNFYLSQFSSNAGIEYDFMKFSPRNEHRADHHTVGLRLETGIQVSSHIAVKVGFYQSLFSTMKINVFIPDLGKTSVWEASSQRLYFNLCYSLKAKKTPKPFIVNYRQKQH